MAVTDWMCTTLTRGGRFGSPFSFQKIITRSFGIELIYFKSLQIPGLQLLTELLQRHYIYEVQMYNGGSVKIAKILVQH